jgi:hypothetical protein
MLNGNATFGESVPETISFFTKKTHFFRFFDFFLKTQKNSQDRFGPQKTSITGFFHIFFATNAFTMTKNFFQNKSDFFS